MTDAREQPRFGHEMCRRIVCTPQHFERNLSLQVRIERAEHASEAAIAELAKDEQRSPCACVHRRCDLRARLDVDGRRAGIGGSVQRGDGGDDPQLLDDGLIAIGGGKRPDTIPVDGRAVGNGLG
jgi:hypothetical protein